MVGLFSEVTIIERAKRAHSIHVNRDLLYTNTYICSCFHVSIFPVYPGNSIENNT